MSYSYNETETKLCRIAGADWNTQYISADGSVKDRSFFGRLFKIFGLDQIPWVKNVLFNANLTDASLTVKKLLADSRNETSALSDKIKVALREKVEKNFNELVKHRNAKTKSNEVSIYIDLKKLFPEQQAILESLKQNLLPPEQTEPNVPVEEPQEQVVSKDSTPEQNQTSVPVDMPQQEPTTPVLDTQEQVVIKDSTSEQNQTSVPVDMLQQEPTTPVLDTQEQVVIKDSTPEQNQTSVPVEEPEQEQTTPVLEKQKEVVTNDNSSKKKLKVTVQLPIQQNPKASQSQRDEELYAEFLEDVRPHLKTSNKKQAVQTPSSPTRRDNRRVEQEREPSRKTDQRSEVTSYRNSPSRYDTRSSRDDNRSSKKSSSYSRGRDRY